MTRWRAFAILAAFALLTLPLMPLQALLIKCNTRAARRLPHLYHRLVARLIGVRIVVKGDVASQGPLLLAPNHVSWIDIVVLSAVAPLSFIAKREVAGWPLFGWLAKLQRCVFVDRERRQATGASHDELTERLTAGDILVLFAEGTSNDGARVLPFKSAFFAAAERLSIPVQPVTLAYTRLHDMPLTRRWRPLFAWYGDMDLAPHLWQALMTGPLEVTVTCHPVLASHLSRKEMAQQAENAVRQGLASALHGPRKIR